MAQSSYLAVNDRRLHLGLGAAEKADLEIRWPNGARETIPKVAGDQLVTAQEGAGGGETGAAEVGLRSTRILFATLCATINLNLVCHVLIAVLQSRLVRAPPVRTA